MSDHTFSSPDAVMNYALEVAARGVGSVEPNPPVGAILVDEQLRLLGEGGHQQYGGPHAEVHALASAGDAARGAMMFVTLEPCCHHGKTPPCSQAVIDAGIRKVFLAVPDPNPNVAGGGIADLQEAGIEVEVGLQEENARRMLRPFFKRIHTGLPYVHAKWAMTLDGKIASRSGSSMWISNEQSRAVVHQLRGRMDAIIVGSGTATADDPLLTARPPGPRTATRIVLDRKAKLSRDSQLVQTIDQAPVMLVASSSASPAKRYALADAGVEVVTVPEVHGTLDVTALIRLLGEREMTNVLIEGGGTLLGSCFDADLIDECHVFIAPKLIGGTDAVSPMGGTGLTEIASSPRTDQVSITTLGDNVYIQSMLERNFNAG